MLQQEPEDQRWGGNGWGGNYGSHGSHRLKATTMEDQSVRFVPQEVDGAGGVLRSGGGAAGGNNNRGEFAASLTLNTTVSCSNGYSGADLTLFSPTDLFSPSSRQLLQQASSPFNWPSLPCGQPTSARWQQPDNAAFPAATTFGSHEAAGIEQQASALNDYGRAAADNVNHDGQNDLCLAHESSASDCVVSEVEVDPASGEVKEEWVNNVDLEKETWRKFGGTILALREEILNFRDYTLKCDVSYILLNS